MACRLCSSLRRVDGCWPDGDRGARASTVRKTERIVCKPRHSPPTRAPSAAEPHRRPHVSSRGYPLSGRFDPGGNAGGNRPERPEPDTDKPVARGHRGGCGCRVDKAQRQRNPRGAPCTPRQSTHPACLHLTFAPPDRHVQRPRRRGREVLKSTGRPFQPAAAMLRLQNLTRHAPQGTGRRSSVKPTIGKPTIGPRTTTRDDRQSPGCLLGPIRASARAFRPWWRFHRDRPSSKTTAAPAWRSSRPIRTDAAPTERSIPIETSTIA